jgi:hypothetical protein
MDESSLTPSALKPDAALTLNRVVLSAFLATRIQPTVF